MLSAEQPSGEVNAKDSVYRAYPPVDRSSTGEHETDDMLTALRHASRTPSAYRASTETGTEAMVSGMITMAGEPFVDRTSTGVHETTALTQASVAEEPRGDPAMVETFTSRVVAAVSESKVTEEPRGDPAMVETLTPRVGAATLGPRSARRLKMDEVGHQSCEDKASS